MNRGTELKGIIRHVNNPMEKEFEALDDLFDLVHSQESFEKGQNCYDILKDALIELKVIKEAKPSEASELVSCLKDYLLNMVPYYDWLNDIEKYILKAQEQEKALKIIFEKKVDVYMLNDLGTLEEYNEWVLKKYGTYYQLTQEEFDLLKRYTNER